MSRKNLFSKAIISIVASISVIVVYISNNLTHKSTTMQPKPHMSDTYHKSNSTNINPNSYQSAAIENNQIQAYFTPQDNCEQKIIYVIDHAKKQILLHAYGFTSDGISKALGRALARGVVVRLLLDKSNIKAVSKQPVTAQDYSTLKALNHIDKAEVVIDYSPGISHNKIIIADDIVITGSFNFTTSAQSRNAENIVIINNSKISDIYKKNWQIRYKKAITHKNGLKTSGHARGSVDSLDNQGNIFG